ncbi:putative DsbA family dithiol-disulfide isomerase [Pontibacter ummariensis]|uniref:Predicted dithiol-disulfide isomerase, DsbA family n=1 Tax=Pontibacter ummariensis TaxID=1610492 RepID=A0A239LEB3_9BACT|nr:DsbA family protein [Pontibacter ummariensis]PRY03660.1 putative DsbA family dithiol-disulfide isomerase [Pontibacter ummariensis]SNT28272.1 Predicted dithiol-disulfide isomerase, DsbA family [Pontibacter ummariensis]
MANPLLCNPETGICEMPERAASEAVQTPQTIHTSPVKIIYFTDPICSSCWGIEPQLRKLKLEYGHLLEVEYRMGGLLPSWDIYNAGGISKPADVAQHWDEVSRYYQMPIDGYVWLTDPLSSSYPPSIAFKAAELQDREKAQLFLRKLREMVFIGNKNIARWEFMDEAALYASLDVAQLKQDYAGEGKRLFEEDLQLARKMRVRGFPTLFFTSQTGDTATLHGFRPYAHFEGMLLQLADKAQKRGYRRDNLDLFNYFSSLTAREFAELKGVSIQEADAVLSGFEQEGLLSSLAIRNGKLWTKSLSL